MDGMGGAGRALAGTGGRGINTLSWASMSPVFGSWGGCGGTWLFATATVTASMGRQAAVIAASFVTENFIGTFMAFMGHL